MIYGERQSITLTPIDSISKALDVANTEVKSGTDPNSLVCEEKWKNNGGDSELHGRTLSLRKGLVELVTEENQCTHPAFIRPKVPVTTDASIGLASG